MASQNREIERKFASLVVRTILVITYLVILKNFAHFVAVESFIEFIILGLEWILFAGLLIDLFFFKAGHRLLKWFLVFVAVKILYYVLVEGALNFQKGILLLILLIVFCLESEYLVVEFKTVFKRHYIPIVILVLVSVVPFYGWYNRYDEVMAETKMFDVQRYAGLWDLPHALAYYVFVLMVLSEKYRGMVWVLGTSILIATGVRSAIIAVAMYGILRMLMDSQLRKTIVHWTIPAAVIAVLLLTTSIGGFLGGQVEYHFNPLVEGDVEDVQYGAGRVGFALILFDQLSRFTVPDFLLGKSATELYRAYYDVLGLQSWPHDDFLTVIYLYGIIGIGMYLWYVYVFPLKTFAKVSLRFVVPFVISISILAVTNGFYTYRAAYLFVLALATVPRELANRQSKMAGYDRSNIPL